jgi:hypothetical protein
VPSASLCGSPSAVYTRIRLVLVWQQEYQRFEGHGVMAGILILLGWVAGLMGGVLFAAALCSALGWTSSRRNRRPGVWPGNALDAGCGWVRAGFGWLGIGGRRVLAIAPVPALRGLAASGCYQTARNYYILPGHFSAPHVRAVLSEPAHRTVRHSVGVGLEGTSRDHRTDT